MTGYQLHDYETETILGSVIITKSEPLIEAHEDALFSAWEDFNKLEETEYDILNVDAFVNWFNENHVTQIERLYLEYIQF